MSGEQHERDGVFEERLRQLLSEDAYEIRPAPAPYPQIRRQGAQERRRRVAAAGAALVVLAALPVGAYALGGDGKRAADTAAARPSATAPVSHKPSASPSPTGPAGPAEPGRQLLDGITLAQAADALAKCIAYDEESDRTLKGPARGPGLGEAAGYRIILAMRSTGDSNAPGDGMYVVAVKEKPRVTRVICNIRDGEAQGLNVSGGGVGADEAGPVSADINGGKLYQQSFLDKGHWKLPFRWGIIGTVQPSVARVTASYGGGTSEAVLDHGWFVATGELNRQVTRAPHLKGYDGAGKLVYDSDRDPTYDKTLP
ncbi:hypothetical protein C3489_29620 [Streptomyces sp. Ru71]|uniref:hypothetical protein n=1 Tax=Streptomyces sp. Ru71 TaxID=2080746 RepID=UPI000CDD47D0|nr:hypothetical protein [Streptomyces sp. Ru71]POX47483.1 hypothetical protein C3489_29620 [Streptomyces sp. Ru71]